MKQRVRLENHGAGTSPRIHRNLHRLQQMTVRNLPWTSPTSPSYMLPPGPYSAGRTAYPYAALIGQAILSSMEHRLTLKDIYEWIATVYPHFKRGENTWMNSIRHVLSTTVHFRKVRVERLGGRSHWAIFDEDLECFRNGEYRKTESIPQRAGGGTQKRSADEGEAETTLAGNRVKRQKTVVSVTPDFPPFSLFFLARHPQRNILIPMTVKCLRSPSLCPGLSFHRCLSLLTWPTA